MQKIFDTAYKATVQELLNNHLSKENIKAIVLLGSVLDKEAVLKYSDIDILVLLESPDGPGSIDYNDLRKIREIVKTLSKKYEVKISILTHTLDDFRNYLDIEFLKHYSQGKVLYRKKDFKFRDFVEHQIEARGGISELTIKPLIIYNLREMRFQIARKFASLNIFNTSGYIRTYGREFIDRVFETADWCLIYKGIWCKKKKEITEKIVANYGKSINTRPMLKAYSIRKDWNYISDEELQAYIEGEGVKFIFDLIKVVLEDYTSKRIKQRVAAVILKDSKILLLHRFKGSQEYYVLPGGGVEEDESIADALRREIKEETDLSLSELVKIAEFENMGRLEHYFIAFNPKGKMKTSGDTNPQTGIKDEVLWCELSEIPRLKILPERIKAQLFKLFNI